MNRQELVKKLELVGRALAKNDLVPVFTCYIFDGTNVSAFDDRIGIVTPCPTDEAFAVNGKTLFGLLSASQSDEVTLTISTEQAVLIKAGKSQFKLPYFGKDEFLFKEPEDQLDVSIALDEGRLACLEACLTTSSKDEATQPALVGVMFHGNLYSTDGDAVTRCMIGHDPKQGYMLPNAFCETIIKIGASPGKLCLNKSWARASLNDNYTVYGRLIENPDPLDHEMLIKSTLTTEPTYVAIPVGLDAALSRARVVADPETKPTMLKVEGGKLHLLTDTSLGTVRDVLGFKHPDVIAMVSAELMQRAIGMTTEMSILDNCTVFRSGEELFQLLSNFG